MGQESLEIRDSEALETVCANCHGRGWRRADSGREDCVLCDGSGFMTTEAGDRVLSLLRHNFRAIYSEMIDRG
jgi:DnaJ-class molecular chaperone